MNTTSWFSPSLKTTAAVAITAAAFASTSVKAVDFDYAAIAETPGFAGSSINFNGNSTFNFIDAAGTSDVFAITNGTGAGLQGDIDGTFTIGNVVGNSAPVTGSGTFTITDAANQVLSATVTFNDIFQQGAVGGLNTAATVNLTNITYGGNNADLVALRNALTGVNTISFQFQTALTLAQLATTAQSTSFSGSVFATNPPGRVPDGGITLALLGMSLLGVEGIRRRMSVA